MELDSSGHVSASTGELINRLASSSRSRLGPFWQHTNLPGVSAGQPDSFRQSLFFEEAPFKFLLRFRFGARSKCHAWRRRTRLASWPSNSVSKLSWPEWTGNGAGREVEIKISPNFWAANWSLWARKLLLFAGCRLRPGHKRRASLWRARGRGGGP